jgi:hypothetical protein
MARRCAVSRYTCVGPSDLCGNDGSRIAFISLRITTGIAFAVHASAALAQWWRAAEKTMHVCIARKGRNTMYKRIALIPLYDERRDRRMAELILVLWLLSLSDLGFTLWAHHFTAFRELNPIARSMLQANLLALLVAFKLVLTALGTQIFWHLRRHIISELSLWAMVGVYVMLTFRWAAYTMGH